MRLHRRYGHGLTDLAQPLQSGLLKETTPSPDSDPAYDYATEESPGVYTINNYMIDTKDWRAFPLGLVSALQYND